MHPDQTVYGDAKRCNSIQLQNAGLSAGPTRRGARGTSYPDSVGAGAREDESTSSRLL